MSLLKLHLYLLVLHLFSGFSRRPAETDMWVALCTEQLGTWGFRNHSFISWNWFYFYFFQIALYLAKRDFVDHVDSVEVVGVFCSLSNTSNHTFDHFTSNPLPSSICRGRCQSGPLWSWGQKRYQINTAATRTTWKFCATHTYICSLSWQCSSTSPVPSAMEAMTWMSWACPSGETSGSSASRFTPPLATPPSPRWLTSSWRKLESRDNPSPSRCLVGALVERVFLSNTTDLPAVPSDANRPAVLSVLTARAGRCWQGTYSTLLDTLSLFQVTAAQENLNHCLFCRRPVEWTLKLKHTSPTSPWTPMRSSIRSTDPLWLKHDFKLK